MADNRGSHSGGRDMADRSGGRGGNPRFRRPRRKVCAFCADRVESIDYKDVARLRKFISERGKILPKRMTGNCAKHQREMTIAIKRARHVAFLPYVID